MAIVINTHIHEDKKDKITRDEFLERVSCVQAIRTNQYMNEEGLTLYIHSLHTFRLYQYIKNAIDKSDFSGLDNYYGKKHFGIEISDKLLSWFKNNELDTIIRQVVCWLAALYWLKPDNRGIFEDQLYLPILEEVLKVFSIYFEKETDPWQGRWEEAKKRTKGMYHSACVQYYGSPPPEIMTVPQPLIVGGNIEEQWWVHAEFDIRIDRFYFRYDDWERIVNNQENDDLLRVESSKDAWSKWKHQFSTFNDNKRNIYSLFNKEATKGYVYVIKQGEENLYKIGYTKNADIKKRLSQLQTGNPYSLEIVGYFQCAGQATEKALHSLFSVHCKAGEWYNLRPQDVKNILDQNWRISENIF